MSSAAVELASISGSTSITEATSISGSTSISLDLAPNAHVNQYEYIVENGKTQDFNSLINKQTNRSLFKWTNDLNDGRELWRRILLSLSGLASFLNALYIVLVIKGKLSSYMWGVIAAIIYGVFAFAYGYVGDAQLNIMVFLPMQLIGAYLWSNQLDSELTIRVHALSILKWIFVIILCAALAPMFYWEIPAFSKLITKQYIFETMITPHILDALTNSLSVVAQVLVIFRYWEQYILWLAVNVMNIIMYSGLLQTPLDINLLLAWIVSSIYTLVGLYTWFRRWKSSIRIKPELQEIFSLSDQK
ncbi:unnamed protein product [Didymodactylos carnosus]|uniref:Nicotinamide mononucleotide transporter n=1 Tax=Didymodactylos carnosus TaxID=1234261 RepID=A0A814J719_9BILA|nr:unnamed protein product [Didymodactylos carnosus]CAF1140470.1 unnamed protein product [Didymodactylos carnosus]CAF3804893.1 unnamed protein product [Didymodactylos carnosus]CAF3934958.1 unnamed protein product [Didymodactylos carnosus]